MEPEHLVIRVGGRSREEAGYSLVEVMASILLLSIAIIPMVGMFDAGLRAASTSGNYDKARALANLKLEEAKSLDYDTVRTNFPTGTAAPDSDGEITSSSQPAPTGFPSSFAYTVEKQYLQQPSVAPVTQLEPFAESNGATDTRLLRVTVAVSWSGNTYETRGILAG